MKSIIFISGIDGSGKSTQFRLLFSYLKKKGCKIKYLWFRWPIFISYPFLACCRVLGYTKWVTTNNVKIKYAERHFYLNKPLAKLWSWFFVIDTLIHSLIQIFIPLKQGFIILCDRYIPDLVVDLICDTGNDKFIEGLPGKLLFALIPHNSKFFLIDVDEVTAYKRKTDIPNFRYLQKRRTLYLALAKIFRMQIIDGQKNPTMLFNELLKNLEE